MTFELGSADLDKNITVKVNDDSYTVAAADIKGDNKIGGIETDVPEQEDPEEEGNLSGDGNDETNNDETGVGEPVEGGEGSESSEKVD